MCDHGQILFSELFRGCARGAQDRSAASTRSAAPVSSSCSHTTIRLHPSAVRIAALRRSRSTFRSSFESQYSEFVRGVTPSSGHLCQKHPRHSTTTRARVKTMSGRNRRPGTTWRCLRKRKPRRCNSLRSALSGAVSLALFPCMTARTAGEEAGGARTSAGMHVAYMEACAASPKVGHHDQRPVSLGLSRQ